MTPGYRVCDRQLFYLRNRWQETGRKKFTRPYAEPKYLCVFSRNIHPGTQSGLRQVPVFFSWDPRQYMAKAETRSMALEALQTFSKGWR